MSANSIWTVSTVGLGHRQRIDSRCWGYYFNLDAAIQGMQAHCDDEAGYYTHAVIEHIMPGIYANVVREEWFRYEDGQWAECNKPASEKHICNYAIG